MNFLGLAFAEGAFFVPGSAVGGVCCLPGSVGFLNCEGVFSKVKPLGHDIGSPRLTRRRFLPADDGGEQPLATSNVEGSFPTFDSPPTFSSWGT